MCKKIATIEEDDRVPGLEYMSHDARFRRCAGRRPIHNAEFVVLDVDEHRPAAAFLCEPCKIPRDDRIGASRIHPPGRIGENRRPEESVKPVGPVAKIWIERLVEIDDGTACCDGGPQEMAPAARH